MRYLKEKFYHGKGMKKCNIYFVSPTNEYLAGIKPAAMNLLAESGNLLQVRRGSNQNGTCQISALPAELRCL